MKILATALYKKIAKKHNGYFAFGIFFILAGLNTSATGRFPKGAIIYDDNIKILYGFLLMIIGIGCIFVGIRKI
ncbi:hypothetical protein CLM76_09715 [Vreelandella venusta]|nr:hypothetical protein CLM76_09715 [Halomonas hydrothermalis]